MKEQCDPSLDLPVTFVGLKDDEQAPRFAAYQVDTAGRQGPDNPAAQDDARSCRSPTREPAPGLPRAPCDAG